MSWYIKGWHRKEKSISYTTASFLLTIIMRFIFFAALFVIAAGDNPNQAANSLVNYPPQPYSYSYNVQDEESNNDFIHSEKTDGKVTTGSYRVSLPDGRTQFVSYKADENGFTANVEYEGEAHHPDGYIAPPTPSFQAPAALPYSALAASSNKVREAPSYNEASSSAAPATKEAPIPAPKTHDAPVNKEPVASAPKTRDAPSYKESSTPSYKDSVTTYSPPAYSPPSSPSYNPPSPPAYNLPAAPSYQAPSPPAYNPPSPPSYQASAITPYQAPAHKTPAYRSRPPTYRAPSPPSYRAPASPTYGFTPIGPTPLAYRG